MPKNKFQVIRFVDILPNPYRDLKFNPLREDAVSRLVASIGTTDYWENVLVRPHPTQTGKFELVYGHHRFEAAKRSGLKEAQFIVAENLSNEQMILRKDADNDTAYNHDLRDTIESVRGIVTALACGDIADFEVNPRTNTSALCYTPSFVPGKPCAAESAAHPYTVLDIAKKLNKTRSNGREGLVPNDEIIAAMNALQLIERGQMQEKDLRRSDGSYKSVEAVLEMTRELKKRYPIFLANVEETKKATAAQKKQIEASLRHAHAEQIKKDKELEKAEQEYTQAKKAEIAVDVKRQAEKLKTIEAERKQNAERIRDYEDKKRKVDQSAEAQRKAEQLAKEKREKQETENWNSLYKTLVDRLNILMSNEDPLYDQLNRWRENSRVTDAQRSGLQITLRNTSNRFVEFNPFKTAPSAKEQEAMKNLKRKAQKRGKK